MQLPPPRPSEWAVVWKIWIFAGLCYAAMALGGAFR
jgi:hypothetical protein